MLKQWGEGLDRWLFGPGSDIGLAVMRIGLCLTLTLRLGLRFTLLVALLPLLALPAQLRARRGADPRGRTACLRSVRRERLPS